MAQRLWGAVVVVAAVALRAVLAHGQACEDFNQCTVDDVCVDQACHGTPTLDAECDAGAEAIINGRCVASGADVVCRGERAPAGTPCQQGCGTLQPPFEGSGDLVCKVDEATVGQACSFGPCQIGTCVQLAGPFGEGRCDAPSTECPDTDGDPCTVHSCSNDDGECHANPACGGECQTCNPATGACEAVRIGAACDDGNPCTTESRCEAQEIPSLGVLGLCRRGPTFEPSPSPSVTPTEPTSTPTVIPTDTPIEPTSTATAPPTDTPVEATSTATAITTDTPVEATPTVVACPGDCNQTGRVTVDEVIVGVNIALGRTAIDACAALDASGDGDIAINELILAVGALLDGCDS